MLGLRSSNRILAMRYVLLIAVAFATSGCNRHTDRFYAACITGNVAMAEQMLRRDPGLAIRPSMDGSPPLCAAARHSQAAVVILLIKHRANPNEASTTGERPLHLTDDVLTAKTLLDFGADINRKDVSGLFGSPLHVAVSRGDLAMAQMLVHRGAHVNSLDRDGCTPLYNADQAKIAEFLIASGAQVDHKDVLGLTPLHVAADNGDTDVVKVLLAHGANPNVRSKPGAFGSVDGITPVEAAQARRYKGLASLMRKRTK